MHNAFVLHTGYFLAVSSENRLDRDKIKFMEHPVCTVLISKDINRSFARKNCQFHRRTTSRSKSSTIKSTCAATYWSFTFLTNWPLADDPRNLCIKPLRSFDDRATIILPWNKRPFYLVITLGRSIELNKISRAAILLDKNDSFWIFINPKWKVDIVRFSSTRSFVYQEIYSVIRETGLIRPILEKKLRSPRIFEEDENLKRIKILNYRSYSKVSLWMLRERCMVSI